MIEHIVLLKVKSDISEQAVNSMVNALRELKSQIPGIVDLSVGKNTSERSQGFTHGLVVRFRDREALETYLPHPAHQDVVKMRIGPIVEDVIAVDYEL